MKKNTKNRIVSVGIASVEATFNNTRITISDLNGAVLSWASAGQHFKGSKKSTPHAAKIVADQISKHTQEKYSTKTISIRLKGPGSGRESAVTALANNFTVTSITDVTPIPHNGCRPPKKRRV